MDGGCSVFMLVMAGLFTAGLVFAFWKHEAVEAARKAYQESLDGLRSRPADPTSRQKALELGRAYATLTRESGKVAIFDEVALMNDINAACAATIVSVGEKSRPKPPEPRHAATLEERLERLKSPRDRGVIDEDEYRSKRAEILRDV